MPESTAPPGIRGFTFTFKFLELILSICCATIHVDGFRYHEEPLPHEMIYCGTYFSCSLVCFIAIIGLFLGLTTPIIVELFICFIASLFNLMTSMFSMMHAEQDFHLQYLTDIEEWYHPYHYKLRMQSMFSLVAALLFGLHGTLLIDSLLITQRNPNEQDGAYQPIEFNNFCAPIGRCILKKCCCCFGENCNIDADETNKEWQQNI